MVPMGSSIALAAGTVATVVFATSTLPMLRKAARSKDLTSYSRSNLVLANVGNAVYSVYVFHLPPGPIWLLHSFYVASSALMLFWSLRYGRRAPTRPVRPARPTTPTSAPGSTPCAPPHLATTSPTPAPALAMSTSRP
jgi:uncharacterized protein with PQ loop repeat